MYSGVDAGTTYRCWAQPEHRTMIGLRQMTCDADEELETGTLQSWQGDPSIYLMHGRGSVHIKNNVQASRPRTRRGRQRCTPYVLEPFYGM